MALIHIKNCNLCKSENITEIDSISKISKCLDCGYIFANPRPSFDDISMYYSQRGKYDGWLENIVERDELWHKRLNLVRKFKKSGNILDIGAGIGQFLHTTREEFTGLYGTEVSESAIQKAKELYNIELMRGKIENIEFNQKFDNISLFHVLEHVEDPAYVTEICHELLRRDGILFIAVPNEILSFKTRIKKILKKIGVKRYRNIGSSGLEKISMDSLPGEIHLSYFTPGVLKHFLREKGFDIVDESLDPYFVETGPRKLYQEIYFRLNMIFFRIFKLNVYDTMWICGKKG